MVIANGFPKAGTHALIKGLELLGVPYPEIVMAHTIYPVTAIPDAPHVVIVRNPRNCLVSEVRFRGRPVTAGFLIGALRDYRDGHPLSWWLDRFQGWLTDPSTHVVRYEDLVASEAALRGLATHLGVPYLEDAFPNLPGLTRTWTGTPSNWRDHWTPEVDAAWRREGLDQCERVYGYDSWKL